MPEELMETPFDRVSFQGDTLVLDGLVFHLEGATSEALEVNDDEFVLLKTRRILEDYQKLWDSKKTFRPRNLLEFGIWQGGSIAFWYQFFQPQKYVAIDSLEQSQNDRLTHYLAAKGLEDRIKTYWSVDQQDSQRLRDIVETEFEGPLDLVIDDASHFYAQTKHSFESLFPSLRPGGLYIIEDWAWELFESFRALGGSWSDDPGLTKLILECIRTIGNEASMISSLTVFQGFVVIERGISPLSTWQLPAA
jgi:Methyltransferase domain